MDDRQAIIACDNLLIARKTTIPRSKGTVRGQVFGKLRIFWKNSKKNMKIFSKNYKKFPKNLKKFYSIFENFLRNFLIFFSLVGGFILESYKKNVTELTWISHLSYEVRKNI